MKTAILITMLLMTSVLVQSQTSFKNNASIIYQPFDNALGLSLTRSNVYISYTQGSYNNAVVNIKTHSKFSLGYEQKLEYAYITLGICYHTFSTPVIISDRFNSNVLKHYSFEIGTTYKYKRISISCKDDILKSELSISLGFNF